MTTQHGSEDAQSLELGRAGGALVVSRRQAISISAGGIVFLTRVNARAQGDSEGHADRWEATGARNGSGADQRQGFVIRAEINALRTERRAQAQGKDFNVDGYLGVEFRLPTFRNLSTSQLNATGTREGPPDRSVVHAGEYFSDGFSQKLMSSAQSVIATALRLPSRLPEGVTISLGGVLEFPELMGTPGMTPFYLKMVEVSNKGWGQSNTLGIGTDVGFFVSVSSVIGQPNSWSVGVYAGTPEAVVGVAVMDAINITDLVRRGELVIEEGLLVHAGPVVVEGSEEVRPIQIFKDIFYNVLGPLSDYRTFQDPLLGSFY